MGIFAVNVQGIQGGIFQMLSHGIISGALFFCVGVIYDRMHTREISFYGGLVKRMIEDMTRREILILAPLAIMTIVLGVYPSLITDITAVSVDSLIADFQTSTQLAVGSAVSGN